MVRLASEECSLRVVADQIGCPTYATDLARAIVQVVDVISRNGEEYYGIYNFSNSGATSWHGFAAEIFRQAGLSPELSPVTTAEYMTPAKRPLYSVLDTSKFIQNYGLRPRTWQEALQDCLPKVIQP